MLWRSPTCGAVTEGPRRQSTEVAARATLRGLSQGSQQVDPLQENDPWLAAANAKKSPVAAPDLVAGVSRQVEQQVVAKLQQPKGQVPCDTQQIAVSVEQSILARLQPQLDAATHTAKEACSRVQALETTVTSVSKEVDSRKQTLREMFDVQMSRIEELLTAKRPRQE